MTNEDHVVWAKQVGFPWWPAIHIEDPETLETYSRTRKPNCKLVRFFGDFSFAWIQKKSVKKYTTKNGPWKRQKVPRHRAKEYEKAIQDVKAYCAGNDLIIPGVQEWFVERVISKTVSKNKRWYLVKWQGWNETEWVSEDNITRGHQEFDDEEDQILQYEEETKKRKRRAPRRTNKQSIKRPRKKQNSPVVVQQDTESLEQVVPQDTESLEQVVPQDTDSLEQGVPQDTDSLEVVLQDTDNLEQVVPQETDSLEQVVQQDTDSLEQVVPQDTDILKQQEKDCSSLSPSNLQPTMQSTPNSESDGETFLDLNLAPVEKPLDIFDDASYTFDL